jgi:hypothetical protein
MLEQELTKLISSRRNCILAAMGLAFPNINALVAYQDEKILLVQGPKEAIEAVPVFPREDRASIIAPQRYITSLAEGNERIVRQAIEQVSDH